MSKLTIQPLNDMILLTEEKQTSQSASGIIIEGMNDNTRMYRVAAHGPDVKKVQIGQLTIIDVNKVTIVKVSGKLMALVKEESILAMVKEEA